MLALTAPRVIAAMASADRALELDAKLYRRTNAVITKALTGGKHLTRPELGARLGRAGLGSTSGQRLGHIMMRAELEGVVCSGPRRGKQFTYALLEERVPSGSAIDRDEALHELTLRYFTTHGPASVRDFAWWSGLTIADATGGIQSVGPLLTHATLDGRSLWFVDRALPRESRTALLLPNYDAYFFGHNDREAIAHRIGHSTLVTGGNALLTHVVVVNGQLVGGWRREIGNTAVVIELDLAVPLTAMERRLIATAAHRFGRFLESPVELCDRPPAAG